MKSDFLRLGLGEAFGLATARARDVWGGCKVFALSRAFGLAKARARTVWGSCLH